MLTLLYINLCVFILLCISSDDCRSVAHFLCLCYMIKYTILLIICTEASVWVVLIKA